MGSIAVTRNQRGPPTVNVFAVVLFLQVYNWLMVEHRARRLGAGAWRVDAVLPGGRLLSEASLEETVTNAFGPDCVV